MLGSNIGHLEWSQAQLPSTRGGIGLRSACSHAAAAFLSSYQESEGRLREVLPFEDPSLDLCFALKSYSSLTGVTDDVLDINQAIGNQKALRLRVHQHSKNTLINDKVYFNIMGTKFNRESALLQS